MDVEGNEVFTQAEKFADALLHAKEEMSPAEFTLLLVELNMKIEEKTKIDYGSVCKPTTLYGC